MSHIPSSLILRNGRIWTADDSAPWASCVGIIGDRFAAVGDYERVRAALGPRAEEIDLDGRFAMPGFIDSHVHFLSGCSRVPLSRRRPHGPGE